MPGSRGLGNAAADGNDGGKCKTGPLGRVTWSRRFYRECLTLHRVRSVSFTYSWRERPVISSCSTIKPKTVRIGRKPLPPEVIRGQRYAFIRPDSAVLEPQFAFQQATDAGMQISDALPHLRKIADQLCFVRSMHTDQFNHAPAQIFFNSALRSPSSIDGLVVGIRTGL